MKRKGRLMDLFGKKVRSNREIQTGHMVIPAGTIFTVGQFSPAWTKLTLTADPCPQCGVRARAIKVDCRDVDLVEQKGPLV